MHKFEIGIELTKNVEVEAESRDDAIEKVRNMLNEGTTVLSGDDYSGVDFTVMNDLCPTCEVPPVSKMFDVDGTTLEEHSICPICGYGTPALR